MVNELIKITEKDGKKAVNARDLHAFLESKQDFSTWIKNRIEKYDLSEYQDFITAPQIYGTANGGHSTRIEYALTIDAAKELSMVEGNEKGKEARRYFIACEKELNSKCISTPNFSNPAEAARAWADEYEKRVEAEKKELESKNRIEKLVHDAKTYTTSEIAKELGFSSARKLNDLLIAKKIQYKLNGTFLLYSNYSDSDLVSIKQTTLDNGKIIYDRRWTNRGREFLIQLIK